MERNEDTPAVRDEKEKKPTDIRLKIILWFIVILVGGLLLSIILGALKYAVDVCISIACVCGVLALLCVAFYYKERFRNEQNKNYKLRSNENQDEEN